MSNDFCMAECFQRGQSGVTGLPGGEVLQVCQGVKCYRSARG